MFTASHSLFLSHGELLWPMIYIIYLIGIKPLNLIKARTDSVIILSPKDIAKPTLLKKLMVMTA